MAIAVAPRNIYGFHMPHPGPAIKAIRQAQGLSLRELAESAQVDKGYLSRVERGIDTPTDRWVKSVEDALARHLIETGAA